MHKVLLTNPIHPEALDLLRRHAEVVLAPAPTPKAILDSSEGCDGIIVRAQLPDGLFALRRSLRAAIRHGTGVDFIPIEEATEHGVVVANVPGVNATSVAEHATLLMLGLARRSFHVLELLKREGWNPARDYASDALELHGCTVGIIGFGSIGRRIAAVWQGGFGAQILVHTPEPADLPESVRACALDVLRRSADFIVVACPLTPATRGMVDAGFLSNMKRSAFLINVARGPIVDQAALADALLHDRIAGAGLDVYETHPLAPDSPLLRMPNVVTTPHCAGISERSLRMMGVGAVEELLRALRGERPLNFVNPEVEGRRRGGDAPWGDGLRSY